MTDFPGLVPRATSALLLATAIWTLGVAAPAQAAGFTVRIVDTPEIVRPSDVLDEVRGPLLPAAIFVALLLAVTSSDTSTGGVLEE